MAIDQAREVNMLYKGWHQDNDPILQPKDTVSDMLNMRLVSNASNSYAAESMLGTEISFVLPAGYKPIGGTSLPNKLIIFSTNGSANSTGKIGVVIIDSLGAGTYTNLKTDADFKFGYDYPIRKAIAIRENDTTERVYWSDFNNSPRVINILDSGIATIPVSILDWTPKKVTGLIDFLSTRLAGSVKCGTWQFFYRLKDKSGITTSWSYPTRPAPVGIPSAGTTVEHYQAYQGNLSTVSSGKAIQLRVSGVDTSYDTIEVAALFASDYQITGNAFVISSGPVSGSTMDFIYSGNENLGIITQEELVQVFTPIIKAKDFEVMKQRMMPGNLQLVGELPLTFDPSSSATITSINYLLPTDNTGFPTELGAASSGAIPLALCGTKKNPFTGVLSGNIMVDGKYIVTGTTGQITYHGVVYNIGDVFVGITVAGVVIRTFTQTGDTSLRAILQWKKFGTTYNTVYLDDDFYDYKGTTVSNHLKGYWRNETYRIGVLPLDLYGNPMFVRWIGDITIPNQFDTSPFNARLCELYNAGSPTELAASIRAIGLEISNLDLSSIADKISGFSIVRAPRDKQILGQGLLWPLRSDSTDIHPQATQLDAADGYPSLYSNSFMFHCPEAIFGFNSGISFQVNDKIDIQDYYHSGMGNLETRNYHYYEKMYSQYTGSLPATGAKGYADTIKWLTSIGPTGETTGWNPYDPGSKLVNKTKIFPDASIDALLGITGIQGRYGIGTASNVLVLTATNDGAAEHKALVNYKRPKGTLYGGNSAAAKAANQYIHCGHFQEINASVYAANGNSWIFNNVQVFGGDCFVQLFDYARVMKWGAEPGGHTRYSHGIIFPVESNINLAYRKGRHLAKDRSYEDDSGLIFNTNGVSQDWAAGGNEDYSYNGSYSEDESTVFYPALPTSYQVSGVKETMVRYSELKFNGETIDNFRRFLANNFKEVNDKYGEINNLVAEHDRLFYLQNQAIGYLPVGERVTINDPASGMATLGEGGIMTRFDELSTTYGSQHQFSLAKLPQGFVWFDMRNRAFMKFDGNRVVDLSIEKGISSFFFNTPVFAINPNSASTILNSDNPFLGYGIAAFYDNRFKEAVMTFHNLHLGTFGIVYSEISNGFQGAFWKISEVSPMAIKINNFLIGTVPARPAIVPSTAYVLGDQVTDYTVSEYPNYICILAFITGVSPTVPSADATHWLKTADKKEMHVHNRGSVCKFYGVVYDNYFEIIANDAPEISKVVDCLEMIGNNNYQDNPFTDYLFNNSYQSASDLNIDGVTVDKNYRLINQVWCSNLPKNNVSNGFGERLVDLWLKMKFRKDNKLAGSYIISKNKITKIVSLISYYRPVR